MGLFTAGISPSALSVCVRRLIQQNWLVLKKVNINSWLMWGFMMVKIMVNDG
jgi:hypothetical protein